MIDVCAANQLTQTSTVLPNILHTVSPASTATADDTIAWTTLSQNNIANYAGTTAGSSCPITRELWVATDAGWLKATDLAVAGSPASYAGKTPKLDWVTAFSNTAAGNTGLATSQAFKISASFDSVWLSGLFVNNVGRTYSVKMISYDPYSLTSKNSITETFTVTFAKTCATDTVCIVQSDGTTCLTAANQQSAADASANINYVVGAAQVTIPKSGKQTVSGCPLTVTYQYFNAAQQSWTDFSTIQNTAITQHASGDGQVNVGLVAAANANNFCPQMQY